MMPRSWLVSAHTSFEEDARRERLVVEVPKVDRGSTTGVVHLTIAVEDIVGENLHCAEILRGLDTVIQWRVVCIGPRRPVRNRARVEHCSSAGVRGT